MNDSLARTDDFALISLNFQVRAQPRQDDLLALLDQVRDEIAPEALAQLQISLSPD